MLEVTGAAYVDGYRLRVHFSDGSEGFVDLEQALWGPVFEPLRALEEFKRFRVSEIFHTVCWDNGADFAPEFLRDMVLQQASRPPDGTTLQEDSLSKKAA
jgi:hypothetical protein